MQVTEIKTDKKGVKTKGRNWHKILDERYFGRNSSSTGFFAFAWDGQTFAGKGQQTFTVPDGEYVVTMSVLKPLGDAGRSGSQRDLGIAADHDRPTVTIRLAQPDPRSLSRERLLFLRGLFLVERADGGAVAVHEVAALRSRGIGTICRRARTRRSVPASAPADRHAPAADNRASCRPRAPAGRSRPGVRRPSHPVAGQDPSPCHSTDSRPGRARAQTRRLARSARSRVRGTRAALAHRPLRCAYNRRSARLRQVT